MSRVPVESTSAVGVGYCPVTGVLEVEFVSGGVYQYLGVPVDEHAALMSASSKGRHINTKIKGRFGYREVLR